MTTRGNLYVFEGPDSVGKSTIVNLFSNKLHSTGRKVLNLSFPGKDKNTLGGLVYSIHHEPQSFNLEKINSSSLQLLHIAAHIDAIESTIKPAIESQTDVVLDRFWWSTVVYGNVYGADKTLLQKMIEIEKCCWGNVKPSILFLISRKEPFDPKLKTKEWNNLRDEYLQLLKSEEKCYPTKILNNERDIEQTVHIAFNQINVPSNHSKLHEKSKPQTPTILKCIKPAIPTKVYDTYWEFAAKRQDVLFKKMSGALPPYTDDLILQKHRFTNSYRVADRVSQYLIQQVIENSEQNENDLFFRIILFKTFNKIDTWEWLEERLGHIHWNEFNFKSYSKALDEARRTGMSIYSAAYIMPSGGKAFPHKTKHRNHLELIKQMMTDSLPSKITDVRSSMKAVFELLCSYPMIGPFLGYQYATDINYSNLTDASEMEFVIPGPGAKDGIRKCFKDLGGLNEAEIIRKVADIQNEEFSSRKINFKTLGGRPLQLIDCQNLFCEVDKYARVAHPDIKGISGRTRIKQQYRPDPRPFKIVLPPKWGINISINPEDVFDDGSLFWRHSK